MLKTSMRHWFWRSLSLLPVLAAIGCGGSSEGSTPSAGAGATDMGAGAGGRSAGGTAGTSSGGALAGAADDRPALPEWNPPIPLGDTGWQDSQGPFCAPQQGHQLAFQIWADASAVHAVFGTSCDSLSDISCAGSRGLSLWKNDGSGWQTEAELGVVDAAALGGLPDGPVLIGTEVNGTRGIYIVQDGQLTLSLELDTLSDLQLFGVGPKHAYARSGSEVLEYRNGSWRALETLPEQVLSISGGDQFVVAVGLNQSIYLKQGSAAFEALPGVPAGDYTASWAFTANDIWAGNGDGQLLHYDGSSWHVLETGSRDKTGSGIVALWGDADTVYFMTFTELGRATEANAELLFSRSPSAKPSEPYFSPQSLWGKSKDELFLAISDEQFAQYACGAAFVVWFDGSKFHQF
ncbi:MAG: hypothetical protein ABIQ16_14810 [Polyangiaceae bacterium]